MLPSHPLRGHPRIDQHMEDLFLFVSDTSDFGVARAFTYQEVWEGASLQAGVFVVQK